jgi:hypothetical protein
MGPSTPSRFEVHTARVSRQTHVTWGAEIVLDSALFPNELSP